MYTRNIQSRANVQPDEVQRRQHIAPCRSAQPKQAAYIPYALSAGGKEGAGKAGGPGEPGGTCEARGSSVRRWEGPGGHIA